ncbi:MAG: response regulator [Fibrobacterota bacterium]|nr:MAG: response regulator [Fibrobacterota bacterium]
MSSVRILMVEDNEDDAFLVQRHLRHEGLDFQLVRVDSSDAFRKQLQEGAWDIILSDYSLPGFSGIRALEILHSFQNDIPFILVSGAVGEQMAVEAMRAGAQDYILKDNLARLVPVIERELLESRERKSFRIAEQRKRTLEHAFQQVLWGTVAAVGEDFFHSLVQSLARSLGFKAAMVAEYSPDGGSIHILAIHGLHMPSQEYPIEGTLAKHLREVGKLSISRSFFENFLDGKQMMDSGLESIMGVRLDSRTGDPQGLLFVMDDKPLSDPGLADDLLNIFAARAGSELDRLDAEKNRRNMELQLYQSQKLEAVGTLAGGIAHDINNILTSIWGHAQLLEMSIAEGSSRESVDGILKGCRRARDLARRILLFGRKQDVNLLPLQLFDIVQEVNGLLKATIPPNIHIETMMDASIPSILGDAGQLHQVILNLCTNAIYAMTNHGGALKIELTEEKFEGDSFLRLVISDTGEGIPAENLSRIFEPFFTTKPTGQGTGLGLSVVHGIVVNHQGTIDVHSSVGVGTTFELRFPAIETDFVLNDTSSVELLPVMEGKQIMIVDDEETVSEVVRQFLSIIGFEAEVFSDPRLALEAFRKNPLVWEAVVSDLTMPEMTGMDLACEIHRIDPSIPFLLTSGFESEDTTSETMAREISAFLPKPFQLDELEHALRKVISKR